ncbi:hypothetical protein [Propionigenium maris]|nr:hypothetical protein [Propionigenium maris]
MSEIYEALTRIGMVFLALIFFMSTEDLTRKHSVGLGKVVGFLLTPLVQLLSIGYLIYKRKREKERQMSEEC